MKLASVVSNTENGAKRITSLAHKCLSVLSGRRDKKMHEHHIRGMLCRHVSIGSHPIMQVIHHVDGMWEFSCGTEEHPGDDAFVGLCLECTMKKMSEFQTLKHMKAGEWSKRESPDSSVWSKFRMPPDEE